MELGRRPRFGHSFAPALGGNLGRRCARFAAQRLVSRAKPVWSARVFGRGTLDPSDCGMHGMGRNVALWMARMGAVLGALALAQCAMTGAGRCGPLTPGDAETLILVALDEVRAGLTSEAVPAADGQMGEPDGAEGVPLPSFAHSEAGVEASGDADANIGGDAAGNLQPTAPAPSSASPSAAAPAPGPAPGLAQASVDARARLVTFSNDFNASGQRSATARGGAMAAMIDEVRVDPFAARSMVVTVHWRHISGEGVVDGTITQVWRGLGDPVTVWTLGDEQVRHAAVMAP